MRSPLAAVCVLLALAAAGCKPPAPPPSAGTPAPKIADAGPPVSEQEATEYGQKLEKAFADSDAAGLADLMRIDDLCRRAFSDFNLPPEGQKGLDDAIRKGAGRQMCRMWAEQMKGVKTLRTRERDGRRTVLIRSYGDDGVNYLEFTLARVDGRPTTEDVYLFMAGETLTQMLRRMMLAFLPVRGGGEKSQVYLDNMPRMKRLREALQAADLPAARREYAALPASLRDDKGIHLQGLRATQDDEPEYLKELERYRRLHPNDPSLDLVMLDYHILKKDKKALHECMTRLDKAVGGDPALEALEAAALIDLGDTAAARPLAEAAVKEEPTFAAGHWALVTAALTDKDHPEALRRLKGVVEACGVELDPEAIRMEELYAGFVKSKEFGELKRWLAERAK